MSKFSLFKELVDFFSFKARRLILLALVAASVAGTFYWHWPAIARSLFAFGYVALIVLAIESQAGYFVDFAKAALGTFLFSRRYKPVPLSSPVVDALARKMGVLGKVKVYSTDNPWVRGPFTNGFTSRIYLPVSWIRSFPKSEIIAVLAHEFSHVTRRLRFALELTLATAFAYGLATFLSTLTVTLLLVFEVTEISLTFLLISFVSWRNEYRADREGARFTGPEGLISVFEFWKNKISRDDGSETHPPLSNRIKKLEPLLDEPMPPQ